MKRWNVESAEKTLATKPKFLFKYYENDGFVIFKGNIKGCTIRDMMDWFDLSKWLNHKPNQVSLKRFVCKKKKSEGHAY